MTKVNVLLTCVLSLQCVSGRGASGHSTGRLSVSVMEGDSVILDTGVKTSQQKIIKWYHNRTRIAQINGSLSFCTDVQCNNGTERFRDRLKLDHQTGSLTITNIRAEHTGDYKLLIINHTISKGIFTVSVHAGVTVKERTVNKGESITLKPDVERETKDSLTWYFNDIPIAEMTGDQSEICRDDQCDERFRDRVNVDHQNGSLTITNTRAEDSGDYKLQIRSKNRRHCSISVTTLKKFTVTITDSRPSPVVSDSGPSPAIRAGICVSVGVVVVVVVLAAAVYRRHWKFRSLH